MIKNDIIDDYVDVIIKMQKISLSNIYENYNVTEYEINKFYEFLCTLKKSE